MRPPTPETGRRPTHGLSPQVIKLSSPATREFWPLAVLHEDDHLLVLDKPAGPPAAPGEPGMAGRPSLVGLLQQGIREGRPWAAERRLSFLRHVCRMDAEASGVLVLARNPEAHTALVNQFHAEKPVVDCVVLTQGVPPESRFEVRLRLSPHPKDPTRMRVDHRHGKKSVTLFERIETFAGHALWRARPLTDRWHQVRLHLRWRRLPVVGDPVYDGPPLLLSRLKPDYRPKRREPERPLIGRAAVHWQRVELRHPATGETIVFESPLPKDFRVALKYLRRYAPAAPAVGWGPADQAGD